MQADKRRRTREEQDALEAAVQREHAVLKSRMAAELQAVQEAEVDLQAREARMAWRLARWDLAAARRTLLQVGSGIPVFLGLLCVLQVLSHTSVLGLAVRHTSVGSHTSVLRLALCLQSYKCCRSYKCSQAYSVCSAERSGPVSAMQKLWITSWQELQNIMTDGSGFGTRLNARTGTVEGAVHL